MGDPGAARALAGAYRGAAGTLDGVAGGLSGRAVLLGPLWQGESGTALAGLLVGLSHDSGVVARELDDLAAAMAGLAADIDHVHWMKGALKAAEVASDVALVASVVQLGVDPVCDAAAVAARAGVAGLTAALKR